jgi:hypothetical protein
MFRVYLNRVYTFYHPFPANHQQDRIGFSMQVNPSARQDYLGKINTVTSDRKITPQEMNELRSALDSSPLSAQDKAAVGQILDKLEEFKSTGDTEKLLSDDELKSIQDLAASLNSPPATELTEHIAQNNDVKSNRSFFQVLKDGFKNFFKAIGNLFGGGDKNNAQSRAQADFNPNGVNLPSPGAQTPPPPLADNYMNDYARPEVSTDTGSFDRYFSPPAAAPAGADGLPPATAGAPGEMYQRSQYHDDSKFVPRFAMAAYHESGVYRKPNDPYAVGAISRPKKSDDLGGKTYGTYQFESSVYPDGSSRENKGGAGSTLSRFINDPGNPFGAQLKAVADQHGLASKEFDALWAHLSNQNNKEFGMAQEAFALKDKGQNIQRFMDKAELSPEVREDPRIQDLIMGTTNHVGGLADGAAEHIAALQRQTGRPLTANEVGKAIAEFKESKISSWFRSSPGAHAGLENRFAAEARAFA